MLQQVSFLRGQRLGVPKAAITTLLFALSIAPAQAQTSGSVVINNGTGIAGSYCGSAIPSPCPTTTISTDGTVTWTMSGNGVTPHTTTADGGAWDSGPLCDTVAFPHCFQTVNGTSFATTLTIPGAYGYHCNIHPNMRGIVVVNPDATHFVVSLPSPVTAGIAFTFMVMAEDAHGNVDTNFNGTVSFSSDDPHPATLPGPTALINGSGTFTNAATFFTAGSHSITVTGTDPIHGAISGNGSTLVNPSALDHFGIFAPASAKLGSNANVTVTADDAIWKRKDRLCGDGAFHGVAARNRDPPGRFHVAGRRKILRGNLHSSWSRNVKRERRFRCYQDGQRHDHSESVELRGQ